MTGRRILIGFGLQSARLKAGALIAAEIDRLENAHNEV